MTDLTALSQIELKALMESLGEPSYRASQIYSGIHKRAAVSLNEMTDIPSRLRDTLSREFYICTADIEDIRVSLRGDTRKYALRLKDREIIEAVYMEHKYGRSVCISSEVGCPMGCRFCASAAGGFKRKLYASEMLSEIYRIERDVGKSITHVDIMGTGEPLHNLDEVLKFISFISDSAGHHLSLRNISLSTSGIPAKIRRLADCSLPLTLCLSLHAADDAKRRFLMPGAGRYSLSEVMAAVRYYFDKTKRRVSFEYILIKDANDSESDAYALIRLLKTMEKRPYHVNLIPLNKVAENDFEAPGSAAVRRFYDILSGSQVNATVRRGMGQDIDSACGQLRSKYLR